MHLLLSTLVLFVIGVWPASAGRHDPDSDSLVHHEIRLNEIWASTQWQEVDRVKLSDNVVRAWIRAEHEKVRRRCVAVIVRHSTDPETWYLNYSLQYRPGTPALMLQIEYQVVPDRSALYGNEFVATAIKRRVTHGTADERRRYQKLCGSPKP